MTQTPRSRIYKYMDIPEDEHFNQERPSFELACGGNRTRGNILGFFVGRACYVAEKSGLDKEQCKVITIFVEREEILKILRISEPTYIAHLKALNSLTYVGCPRYARGEYTVNLEAVNKGIADPPQQIRRGRPKGTGKSLRNKRTKKASTFQETSPTSENTLTLPEIALTFIRENGLTLVSDGLLTDLRQEVKAISHKAEMLEEKVKAITENPLNITGKVININTFQKYLELSLKRLKLSLSDEDTLQAVREAFSEPLDYLDSNEREESIGDAPFVAPTFASSDHSQQSSYSLDGYTQTDSIGNNSSQDGSSPTEPDAFSEDVTQASDGNTGVHGYVKSVDKLGDTHDNHTSRSVHPDRVFDRDALEDTGHTERDTAGATGNPSPAVVPLTQQAPLTQTMASALPGDARERTIVPPSAALLPSHTYDMLDVFAEDTWIVVPGQATGMASGEETLPLSLGDVTDNGTGDGVQGSTTQPASLTKTGETDKNKKAGPPSMPGDTALWNAETLVQVCEAYKGRRYPNGARKKSDRIRDTELAAAHTLLTEASDIWTEDTVENRENLLKIIKHVQNRKNRWWLNNVEGGYVNPRHLVDKDRIHAMWDELQPTHNSNSSSPSSSAPLGGMYKDKTAELAAQRAKYMQGRPVEPTIPFAAAHAPSAAYSMR